MNREAMGTKMKIIWVIFTFSLLFNFYKVFLSELEPGSDRRMNAVLWFQNAGEMRALSYQAFNLARMRLDQDLNSQKVDQRQQRAIVVDVDETVLDNSSYTAKNILIGKNFPTGWQQWLERSEALAMPGAVEFLKYAASRQVSIFYITNRKDVVRKATIRNLKAHGFPVRDEYMMLQHQDYSKEPRIQKVLENHRIVLLIGDNLGDFGELFEASDQKNRNSVVDEMQAEFGRKFIVMPNPIYGRWERIIPDYKKALHTY